jgi:hypothetical protein
MNNSLWLILAILFLPVVAWILGELVDRLPGLWRRARGLRRPTHSPRPLYRVRGEGGYGTWPGGRSFLADSWTLKHNPRLLILPGDPAQRTDRDLVALANSQGQHVCYTAMEVLCWWKVMAGRDSAVDGARRRG